MPGALAGYQPTLGVDEKAFARGHLYFTLVSDLDAGCVLYVGDDRKQESLDQYGQSLTRSSGKGSRPSPWTCGSRMSCPLVRTCRKPKRRSCSISSTFAKHLHEAVDRARRLEARLLRRAGDDRLVGTKYLWLMRPKDMQPDQRATLRMLLAGELKVAQAWALKERFRQFWEYTYLGAAQRFFGRWFSRASHSRLQPMAQVAWMIRATYPTS